MIINTYYYMLISILAEFLEKQLKYLKDNFMLSWRRSLSYKNQSIDLQSKSKDWFLYDRDVRHEKVKECLDRRLKLTKSGAPAWLLPTETVVQWCSVKEMFLEISQNLASDYNFIKKDTLAQVFSCEFYEISKNNFFLTVHLRWLLLYRNVITSK